MINMTDITIIIPCHQFDDRVAKAIQSAQWAKEVLIIDQNSQIDWEKLKEKYQFRVIDHPKLTSFSDMKNEAIKEVSTEWIFFLDSDEFISKELETELQKRIQENSCDGFSIRRRDIFLNKTLFHGETRSANFIKVVKREIGLWKGRAHEKLTIKSSSAKVEFLESPLFHEPHLSIFAFVQKINVYTSFLENEKTEKHPVLKLLFFPAGKFLYTFFLKLGFLDGYRGLVYSFVMSIHSSAVRIKRYEKQ